MSSHRPHQISALGDLNMMSVFFVTTSTKVIVFNILFKMFSQFCTIRRIANNDIKPAVVEDVFEPGVPEEEVLIGGWVEFVEVSGGAADEVRYQAFDFVVDGLAHTGLLLMVGDGEVVAHQALQVLLAEVAVQAQQQLCGLALSATQTVGDAAQVDALVALDKAVALHKLVVEVGEWLWLLGVDHDAEPETQTGDVDGTALDVYAVDVVLDDLLFQFHTRHHAIRWFFFAIRTKRIIRIILAYIVIMFFFSF